MKPKRLFLKAAVGLLILIPLSLNSCEIEEDPEWCVVCTYYSGIYFDLHNCFDSRQEAQAYKEYMEDYGRSGRDVRSCYIEQR